MKKNKKNKKKPSSPVVRAPSLRIAEDDENKRLFRIKKQKNAVKRELQTREKNSRADFERKRKTASDEKAPLTSRTRGYYRFSRDYPAVVDENRFRENLKYGEKSLLRHAIIAAFCCVIAFCVGFLPARTAMYISSAPVEKTSAAPIETENRLLIKGMFISYDELKEGNVYAITGKLTANGCDTAVFEFKDDGGYCIFNTGSFIGTSADKRIPNAYDTVNAVKAAGFSAAAYISCFLDSCASVADYTYAVRSGSAEGGAWRDNSSRCWLNPYSQPATEYLISLVRSAAENGFSRIILGNVCFPTDSGETESFFDGEAASNVSRNAVLRAFIASAVTAAGDSSVTVMCDLNAVNSAEDNRLGGTDGSLLGSAAGSVCIDARASVSSSEAVIGDKTITGASSMPYVLVSESARYAVNNAKTYAQASDTDADGVFLLIDGGENAGEEITALTLAGANGFIIKSGSGQKK